MQQPNSLSILEATTAAHFASVKKLINIDEGKKIGYTSMKLDTSIRQTEAISLDQGLGFKKIAAYYPVSKRQNDWLVFMELSL